MGNKREQINFIDPIPKDWVNDKSRTHTNFFHYITGIITYTNGTTQKVLFTKEQYQEHILLESIKDYIKDEKIIEKIIEHFERFKESYSARIEAEASADESW